MSRTNFTRGICRGVFSSTGCPFSVGSCLCPQLTDSLSLSAFRAATVVLLGDLGYFSFRFLPLVVLPETLSLLRFAWLADWVAICQPGFYWRLEAYSYLRSCEGAYS